MMKLIQFYLLGVPSLDELLAGLAREQARAAPPHKAQNW